MQRDTKGGVGQGCLIVFSAEEVSDVPCAIEVAHKDLKRTFGDVPANDAGHIELQHTTRASFALQKAFDAPIGRRFRLTVGISAVIGVRMVDAAPRTSDGGELIVYGQWPLAYGW